MNKKVNKNKILVLGGSGLVGSRFIDLNKNSFEIDAPSHEKLNLLDSKGLETFINNSQAEVVINFAAFTNVDKAEDDADNLGGIVYKLNAQMPKDLAGLCKSLNKYLIHISTDYVFDGTKVESSYKEEDRPNPICWYAKTKYFGEQNVFGENSSALVARVEMPFSAHFDKKGDFARFFLDKLKSNEQISAVSDQKITPIFVDDVVYALVLLINNKKAGIIHIASEDWTTPYNFAKKIAQQFNLEQGLLKEARFLEFNKTRKAPRPQHSWLDTGKFRDEFTDEVLHTVEEEIKMFKEQTDSLQID